MFPICFNFWLAPRYGGYQHLKLDSGVLITEIFVLITDSKNCTHDIPHLQLEEEVSVSTTG